MPKLEAFASDLPDGFRYAVELRHRSWADQPDALELLRLLNSGLAMARHPWYARIRAATTDFAYLRLLGRRNVFPDLGRVHRPQEDMLEEWAGFVNTLRSRVTRAFVNNQLQGHRPATVARLRGPLRACSSKRTQTTGNGSGTRVSDDSHAGFTTARDTHEGRDRTRGKQDSSDSKMKGVRWQRALFGVPMGISQPHS